MPSKHGALIVVGSGPGIGRHVAITFAQNGFRKIILMSRNKDRLSQDTAAVLDACPGVEVQEIIIDAADSKTVDSALCQADQNLGDTELECVLYNSARPGTSQFFDFEVENFETDLRITIMSLYTVAKWAMPKLLAVCQTPDKTPSILVTSGMLAKDPFPAMFSLATCKGGQYNLVHAMHKEYEPKGVHCAVVIVGGTVAEESKVTNPSNIAKETWKLFRQPQGKGQLEICLDDPGYGEHVSNRERRD